MESVLGRHEATSVAGRGHAAPPRPARAGQATVGLDPEHRRRIWERFRELAAGGVTLLVTTHIMDEALQCDDVAMLRNGRVIAYDTPSALLAQTGAENLEDAFLALAGGERKEASHA
ncbi:hypothetical protein [Enteroscipio rubneri]|uniref:hypothetical protein n=1 Tax=Enteroscipio rubneri TaxID=2070686 RepID=UPI003207B027